MKLPSTDREPWRLIRGRMSQDAFIQNYNHPFLVVGRAGGETRLGFFTRHATDMPGSSVDESGEDEVIALVKGGANPYSQRLIIGRARNCDIVLRNSSISKVHAEVTVLGPDVCEITDRQSRNGTFVAGEKLRRGERVRVRSGEFIRFGGVGCALVSAADLIHVI